jgi:hypothetical protein
MKALKEKGLRQKIQKPKEKEGFHKFPIKPWARPPQQDRCDNQQTCCTSTPKGSPK